MVVITNKQILGELRVLLKEMDLFTLYPSKTELRRYIDEGVSDTDKIRLILRDEVVQREIFPNWYENKDKLSDPVQAYKDLRMYPEWPLPEGND